MKKTICTIALIILSVPFCFSSDSVYGLKLSNDLVLGSSSLGVFLTSQLIPAHIAEQPPIETVNSLDALAMYSYNETLDDLGSYLTYTSLLLPAVSVLYKIDFPKKFITYAVMYSETVLFTYGTKDILKGLVSRYRPYSYFDTVPIGEEDDMYNSFPSGHTTLSFMSATFLSTTFCNEYPDSVWRFPICLSSYALAALGAVSRITSGNHYITDIIGGAIIGSFWGWFIPRLHKPIENADLEITCMPAQNGVFLSCTY